MKSIAFSSRSIICHRHWTLARRKSLGLLGANIGSNNDALGRFGSSSNNNNNNNNIYHGDRHVDVNALTLRLIRIPKQIVDNNYQSNLSYARRFFAVSTGATTTNNNSLITSLPPPLRKILVANRGEIAIRIIQSAREHGIRTVAIYSSADARSPHVTLADEAVCLGPDPASSASYLDIDKVCEAVRMTNSEGVHPGYGFLSENCKFAERVESIVLENLNDSVEQQQQQPRRNVKFIGPSTHAIQSLGDKIQSKLIAASANVSTVPGFNGVVTSPAHALEIAHEIGYPVMIKASAGGGGKGMRICYTDEEVMEGYRLSKAESKSFFGDDRLLVEKYVEDPHHIEIQVLAGTNPITGQLDILCFAERECSIQRRNQKVIEESPSPHLLPATRREMIRQVKSLVRAVGYESAGTVEFLVDANQKFYFLEMNTRLQVEHPVTEMISGDGFRSGRYVDLVHGMLEVAAGRGIPQQYLDMAEGNNAEDANVRYTGHAIEARVYAEDPYRGFLPSTGPLVKYMEPPPLIQLNTNEFARDNDDTIDNDSSCNIRIDSGAVPGAIITTHYDPIISKIISYSPISREHAIQGLGMALDRYVMRGVQHNIPFVRDVLRNADFVKGYTPTGFIGQHYPDGFKGAELSEKEKSELVVMVREIIKKRRMERMVIMPEEGCDEDFVVCLGGMFGDAYHVRSTSGETLATHISASVVKLPKHRASGVAVAEVNAMDDGDVLEPQLVTLSSFDYKTSYALATAEIAGEIRALQIHGDDEIGMLTLTMYGSDIDALVMSLKEYQLSRHMHEPAPLDFGNFVLSPMPGTLISFAVKEGDVVELGQELCVVEAMKMQNIIRSHKAGARVGKLHGKVGASLRADEILVEFEKNMEASS